MNRTPADAAAHVGDARGIRAFAALVLGLFVLRVGYLAVCPLELCPDEAYYWDWSRQLDWGYFSKPPMIAWLIALATRLGGHSEFAIRLPAAILGSLGLWPVFALGRSMGSARVGVWAAVAIAATPGMAAMSLLMTIDAPFLCAWAFAVWTVWELLKSESPDWRWLPAAILSTGLGLLSKQTMLGLFPLVLIWLASDGFGRRQLQKPAVWLWMGASLLFLTPVLWWNQQHGWVTLQHTREHFQSRTISVFRHVAQSAEFWASQFGMLSPITAALIVTVGAIGLATFFQCDRRVRFLLCLGALPMLGVTALSLTQRVQPNWPAAFHLTGFVLVAGWACREFDVPLIADCRRAFPLGIVAGAVLAGGVYAVPFVVPQTSLAGGKLDATARLRGWKTLGVEVGAALQAVSADASPLVIAATSRGPVSALAYYLPGQPRVYRWNPTGLMESQHEIWGGPGDARSDTAVIVTHRGQPIPVELAAAFEQIQSRGDVSARLGDTREEALSVWFGRGYRGWPSRGVQLARNE